MDFRKNYINLIKAFVFLFSIGYLFYRNIIYSLLLSSLSIIYLKIKNKKMIQNERIELNNEFKEALFILSASLKAGKSIEKSFEDVLHDIDKERCPLIYKEFYLIVKKINLNIPIEKALVDFANRSDSKDIKDFADIFIICKRTEGDLIRVIQNTSMIMNDKIDMQKEIHTMIAQRKYEQKLLMCMPFVVIIILSLTNSSYMLVMYTTIKGRIIMTISLLLIATSYYISQKIMNIEV